MKRIFIKILDFAYFELWPRSKTKRSTVKNCCRTQRYLSAFNSINQIVWQFVESENYHIHINIFCPIWFRLLHRFDLFCILSFVNIRKCIECGQKKLLSLFLQKHKPNRFVQFNKRIHNGGAKQTDNTDKVSIRPCGAVPFHGDVLHNLLLWRRRIRANGETRLADTLYTSGWWNTALVHQQVCLRFGYKYQRIFDVWISSVDGIVKERPFDCDEADKSV